MGLNILAIIFSVAAGCLLFLQVYNRLLLHMKHGKLKSMICYTAMILFPCIPGLFSLVNGTDVFNPITILIFITLVMVEISYRIKQISFGRSMPDETVVIGDNRQSLLENTTETLVARDYQLSLNNWTGPRLRMAHLSDFHVDNFKDDVFLDQVIDSVNRLEPEVIFLTGDYVDETDHLQRLTDLVSRLYAPLGIYSCLGNHDFWSDPDAIRKSLEVAGVVFPPAEGVTIKLNKTHDLRIFRSDYPYVKPWSFSSGDKLENTLDIVLSHTPDHFYKLAECGADLVFSGHLHGGQWRIPAFGSVISPSIRDRLFDLGHFPYKDTDLFVTAGIGTVWMPFRINCPAEILLVNLSGDYGLFEVDYEKYPFSPVQKELPEVLETVR